jgi:hypothetical protein
MNVNRKIEVNPTSVEAQELRETGMKPFYPSNKASEALPQQPNVPNPLLASAAAGDDEQVLKQTSDILMDKKREEEEQEREEEQEGGGGGVEREREEPSTPPSSTAVIPTTATVQKVGGYIKDKTAPVLDFSKDAVYDVFVIVKETARRTGVATIEGVEAMPGWLKSVVQRMVSSASHKIGGVLAVGGERVRMWGEGLKGSELEGGEKRLDMREAQAAGL